MSDKYIRYKDVIKVIDQFKCRGISCRFCNSIDECDTLAEKRGMKKLVVEATPVRHGRWTGISDGYADGYPVYDAWECSVCGYDADGAEDEPIWSYCPHCGAKMDEEGKQDA